MANNKDIDISLIAGLDESYSEQEILRVIKIIEKRLRAKQDGRIKLVAEIDENVIKETINKLQTILKSKDLKIDTKDSIQAITKEVNAMADVATMAKKASVEKLEFTKANEKLRDSAEDSADAINRERSAMESMGSVDDILNGLSGSGRRCASVFQNLGSSFRDAFLAYGAANLLERSLDKIGEAGRDALEIVKQYDDINVDLQLATGEDKNYVKGLISDYAELGNELGSLTQNVAESADSFLRQGRSIEETNKLIEDSIVLSKVAKTSGENASEILTATINGFQLAASEGSKVNDVLSSIDLHSASDASGIGDALTKVASMANNAGVSLEKTAAMIATIKDVTQDADTTIGTSLKTVLSRMNSIRAGKFVDEETGEALNDVEKVLDAIGFSMRDVNGQFKEAETIIDEVGAKWSTLDKNTQKAVTTAMGGTYQANKLVALFDNYDKVLELTNVAENSQGQALQKFNDSYLPSLEAKTQALQNSLEQLATTTFDDTLLASVLDVSKGLVDVTTETGILRGALAGLGAGGSLYVFSQLAGFLGEATQEFANLNEAMNITRSGAVVDIQRLTDLTSGLSQSQLRLVFSSQNLDEVQRIAILTQHNLAQGMSRELAEATARATLNTWGLTSAQQGMTAATVTLSNVVRGLYQTLIANPIVLVTMAVTAGVTAFNKYKQAQEEVIQSAREASNAYQDNIKSVEDYTARYAELRTALLQAKGNEEETYAVKEQLLALQTELNDKFADEYGAINLVTDAYKDQTEAIKNYNKEVANSFLNEERKGIDKATKEMTKDKDYVLSGVDISLETPEGKELKDIVDSYIKEGMYLLEGANGTVQIHLETDAKNAYDTINAFENAVREKAKELGNEHLFDSVLDTSSISLNKAKETIDEYGDIFKKSLMAELVVDDSKATIYNDVLQAVEEYNKAVLNSEDLYSDENVANAKKKLDEVKAKISENVDEWRKYSPITDEVFAKADTRLLEFNQELQNNKELLEDAESLRGLDNLDLESFNIGENEAFDRLKESAENYNVSVEELISSLIRLGLVQGEIQSSEPEIETIQWDASSFNDTIKSYEEGYSKLIDAQEEWNNAQSISAETFADLQENGLLEYIDITSEGLTVNTDKLLENAQASKDKAVADLHAAMMSDMLKIALGDVDSISEDAKSVIAELGDNTETAGQQALNSVTEWATLGATISNVMAQARGENRGFNGISEEQKAQMESVYNYYTDMADKVSAIDITTPARTGGSNAGKSTANAYVKAFEKELESLEILRDSGEITEKEYLDRLRDLYTKYFADRKEYIDELRKYETKYLEGMESLYNSALSGISKLLGNRIDAIEKEKDAILDALEEEKDAHLEVYESQIKAKQEIIDSIQKEIDRMREANEERKRQINLQQKQFDLERLQNQRTIMTYKNGQVVYETDTREIFEAREQVEDAKFGIEISKKEKEITLIKEEIELLEKQKESVESYYDKMIEQQEKYFDSLIKNLEMQKSKWEELADIKEVAEAYSAIEQVFGDLGYTVEDVLNGSEGAFEDFKSKYISILSEMNSNTSFGEGLDYAVKELDKSLSTLGKDTQGLDDLSSKIDEVTSSVGNVTNAINGSSGTSTTSNKQNEEGGGNVSSGTGSNLKDALADQTEDALVKLEEQSNAFSGGEESLEGAVQKVVEKIAGGSSEEGEEISKASGEESEADATNLKGAIQAQYDTASEVIPPEIELFESLKGSIQNCVTELNNMITALEKISALESGSHVSASGYSHGGGGNSRALEFLAKGTEYAKKGLAIVGEEKPELIEDTKGNLSLATTPTLLNMEGGEKVYNGDETEKLLKPKQNADETITLADGSVLKPLDESNPIYAMYLKAQKYFAERPEILYPTQNVWSRQMEERVNSLRTAPVVNNNKTQTQHLMQNINVTLPNVTNETGFNNFKREMMSLQNDALQRSSITR